MKKTSKMKMTSKMMRGGGLSSQTMFPAPDTFKSCKWHSSIANWNYSGSGRLGPIVIIKLSQPASRAGALAWLSLAIILEKQKNAASVKQRKIWNTFFIVSIGASKKMISHMKKYTMEI